jgi:hypothetical protein
VLSAEATASPGLDNTIDGKFSVLLSLVLRIRIRIRIHMFLGLLDPDPSVRGMDLDLQPSITKQKK